MGFWDTYVDLMNDVATAAAGLTVQGQTETKIITGYDPETYSYVWSTATDSLLDDFSGRTNSAVAIAKTREPTQISSLIGTGATKKTLYPIGDPFIGISTSATAIDVAVETDGMSAEITVSAAAYQWEVAYENSELTALLSKFGVPENPILTNAQVLALTLNSVFTNMAEMLLNTQIESSQTFKRIEQKTLTSEQITPATLSAQEASARHLVAPTASPAPTSPGSASPSTATPTASPSTAPAAPTGPSTPGGYS